MFICHKCKQPKTPYRGSKTDSPICKECTEKEWEEDNVKMWEDRKREAKLESILEESLKEFSNKANSKLGIFAVVLLIVQVAIALVVCGAFK